MVYHPTTDQAWEPADPTDVGFDADRLAAAIGFAEAHESPWPRDLEEAGNVPGLNQFEKPPWNQALGPFKPRGGPNGVLLKSGRMVGRSGSRRHDLQYTQELSGHSCRPGHR